MIKYPIIFPLIYLILIVFSPAAFAKTPSPPPTPGAAELIKQLGDGDTTVRGQARVALSRMGESAVPEILKKLPQVSPDQAYDLILLLNHLEYRKAAGEVEKLWQAAQNPKVRAVAAMFLCCSDQDYEKYQDYLVAQAKKGPETDRLVAMQVMGYIKDARVVPPLKEIFYDAGQSDKVRQAAIWDLGHTPVPEAAQALVEMVNSSEVDWFYKEIIIASIRRLAADKKMAPVITRLLEKSLHLPTATAATPIPINSGKKKK